MAPLHGAAFQSQHRPPPNSRRWPVPDARPSSRLSKRGCRLSPLTAIGGIRPGAKGSACCLTVSILASGCRQAALEAMGAIVRATPTPSRPSPTISCVATSAPVDAGAALYVAAALQVYFTCSRPACRHHPCGCSPSAGYAPAAARRRLPGVITASGGTPGTRYLYCSLCATAWNHVRAVCITCGEIAHAVSEGHRGRSGRDQSRDLRRLPHATRRCCTRRRTCRSTRTPTISPRWGWTLVAEAGWLVTRQSVAARRLELRAGFRTARRRRAGRRRRRTPPRTPPRTSARAAERAPEHRHRRQR